MPAQTLHDLDPVTVGRAAVEAVLRRLGRLALPLGPGVTLDLYAPRAPREGEVLPRRAAPESGDLDATDLALTVAQLCRWAQAGDLGDWTDHEDAADALLSSTEALYAAPLADAWSPEAVEDAADAGQDAPASSVALVMACALSRLRVCRGGRVTLAELARLAGVAGSRVRQLVAAGEVTAAPASGPYPSTVTAAEARRWLAARGLAGWATP